MDKFLKVMAAAVVGLVVLVICLGMKPMKVSESYIEHVAKPGDTMWGIANAYYPLTNTGMSFAEYEYNLRHMNEHVQPALGAGYNGARIMQPGDKVKVPVWRRSEQ